MADFGSALWNKPAAADDSTPADPVTRSLRFNDGSSPYFVRAASDIGTPTDAKKVTVAFWFKLGSMSGARRGLVSSSNSGGSDYWMAEIDASDRLSWGINNGSGSVQGHFTTNRVFRDPSAWYHVCFSCDSTAAEADRAIIYVNGVRETSFSTTNYWPADWLNEFNEGTYSQSIGSWLGTSLFFDGLIADVYNIDGQQLEPTEFIEANDYGGYKPKEYTGTYGNNGWHIDMQPQHDADLLVSSIGRNDGDTTFADAAQGHGLTVSGDTEHSIAVGNPFTGDDRAIKFTGSNSNNLQTDASSDLTFGTGDFYIQTWVNPSTVSTQWQALIGDDHYSSSNGFVLYMGYDNLYCYRSGSAVHTINDVFTVGKWTHVAWSRSGGTSKVYVDGVEMASASNSYDFTSDRLWIGRQNHSSLYAFNGYLYDVEIRVGAGGDGSKPTSKVSAGANTELLIQPDKDNAIHDETGNRTITTNGTVTRTASTPYDAAAKSTAMYFAGTGDNLVVTSDSSFNEFGTGDFTIEMWVNPTDQGSGSFAQMFELYGSSSDRMYLRIERQSSQNVYKFVNAGSNDFDVESDSAPDYGNWQHLAVVRNGTSITMYVDGTAQTDSVTISSSATYNWASTNLNIGKGSVGGSSADYEGYIFDYRITKGTARYTSNFTAPSAPFELNPVYIGGDQSGNKNHFQPTNINSTDIREDNPFKNHATWNPLIKRSSTSNIFTYSEGNTVATYTGGVAHTSTTIASSGVHYAEFAFSGSGTSSISGAGVVRARWNDGHADSYTYTYNGCYYGSDGTVRSPDASHSVTAVGSNRLGIAFDGANNKADFYKVESDGAKTLLKSLTSSDSIDFDGSATFTATSHDNAVTTITGYFEAGEWWGTAPDIGSTTATALNTSNLTAPTVTPSEHFNTVLYSGSYDNSSGYGTASQGITGVGFSPAIIWIKDRDNQSSNNNGLLGHYWFDTVLGTGSPVNIDNEQSISGSLNSGEDGVSSFDSDGFTVDEAEETNFAYDSTWSYGDPDTFERYVAWCWKLGTTASSWSGGGQDPDTEHYNSDAGISVIDYTDGDSAGTSISFNHSLGTAPEFVIAMDFAMNTNGHNVWHKDLPANQYLALHSNGDAATDSAMFPSGAATNTTFTIGSNLVDGMQTHAALFRSVEGFSKFGKYKGAGSSGVFVYTGHRPKMVWLKNIDTSGSWMMFDAVRDTYNETVNYLQANSSTSETTNSGYKIDILSNGFRINVESTAMNNSAYDYVFCSWAEQPFAAPSNAR